MTDLVAAVCAVVVTYRPDKVLLDRLLVSLGEQVKGVVVVDNTADALKGASIKDDSNVSEVLRPDHNIGLAAAQNLGISWARNHGFSYVLILDQDSEPGPGMVRELLKALIELGAESKVAAVGPRFYDVHERTHAPFVKIGFPFNRKLWRHKGEQTVKVDFLISSGSLIPVKVINEVGLMDADLFIDSVDLEWSFRARWRGYALYGVYTATMHHSLGDGRKSLPFFPRGIVIHSPLRLYYMTRNRLLLYRNRHTPKVWVAQDMVRLVMKFFLFGVLVAPRSSHLRFMFKGLWDGMRGRTGMCPLEAICL